MASESVYVNDTYEAITNGIIPGEFVDGLIFKFPTIKSTNSKGKTLLWTIMVCLRDSSDKTVKISNDYLKQPVPQLDGYTGVIIVSSSQEGGKVRSASDTLIGKGKNIGKKNATNVITQAFRDALSKYNNKLKTASADTVKEGKAMMYPPVLIKKNGDTKAATVTEQDIQDGIIVQPKLDGVRVVSYYEQTSNTAIMYSRKLGIYPGKEHIKHDLLQLFHIATNMGYNGIYIDGEVYKHGLALQDISGQSRRTEHELDEILEYHVFDCFFPERPDMPCIDRQQVLEKLFAKYTSTYIKKVENIVPSSLDEVYLLKDQFMKNGYEGIIVRRNSGVYKYSYNNARTSDIIKFKGKFTDEFECIGFKEGKGKNKGVLTWICQTKDGSSFSVDPKDITLEERKHLFTILELPCPKNPKMTNFDYYLKGKPLTIEYEDLSKKGVPLRLKALTFRTYEDHPGHDPIAELMKL
jgi:ATP-dependent DNA ligase